jgi:amino acid permease
MGGGAGMLAVAGTHLTGWLTFGVVMATACALATLVGRRRRRETLLREGSADAG